MNPDDPNDYVEFNLDRVPLLVGGCSCSADSTEMFQKDESNTHKEDCRRSRPDRITEKQMVAAWMKAFL